jgi:hypothetical protein
MIGCFLLCATTLPPMLDCLILFDRSIDRR